MSICDVDVYVDVYVCAYDIYRYVEAYMLMCVRGGVGGGILVCRQ